MKIYTEGSFIWDANTRTYKACNDEKFYEYEGNLARCGGSDSGGGGSTSSTTTSVPWSEQIPYLKQGFQQAQNLFINNIPQYYPGQQTPPFSPETQTSLQLQTLRALNGNPLEPLSNVQGMATLAGGYLPSDANNPYTKTLDQQFNDPTSSARFNQAVQAANNQIIPAIDSSFENSGRLNSGLAQQAKTQAVSDAFANMYFQDKGLTAQDRSMMGQNYMNERDNQMRTLMMAPTLANQDYQNIAALGDAGATQDAMNQQLAQNDMNKYNFNQNIRQQELQNYMQLVTGNYGGTTTTTGDTSSTLPSQNPLTAGLGGALAGGKIAGMIKGASPLMGAGIGGGLGILSGLF